MHAPALAPAPHPRPRPHLAHCVRAAVGAARADAAALGHEHARHRLFQLPLHRPDLAGLELEPRKVGAVVGDGLGAGRGGAMSCRRRVGGGRRVSAAAARAPPRSRSAAGRRGRPQSGARGLGRISAAPRRRGRTSFRRWTSCGLPAPPGAAPPPAAATAARPRRLAHADGGGGGHGARVPAAAARGRALQGAGAPCMPSGRACGRGAPGFGGFQIGGVVDVGRLCVDGF
jgi:hypothetical protein